MKWSTTFAVIITTFTCAVIFSPRTSTHEWGSNEVLFGIKNELLLSLIRTIHLASFASALGASLWVTFIGGIIMFRNLPRHQFGKVQGKLFPAYFILISTSSAICLVTYAISHPFQKAQYSQKIQYSALGATLLFALLNIVILEPKTSQIMNERHKVEKEEGIGDEVGLSRNQEVAKTNKKLAELNKRFGMYHGLASLANLISFGGIVVHLCYLGSQLNL